MAVEPASATKSKVATLPPKETSEEERTSTTLISEGLVSWSNTLFILTLKFGLEELVELHDLVLGQCVVLVLVALIGVALAAPQGNDNSRVMETPKFKTLAQEKIVELYEFLKSQLEDKNEVVDASEKETLRNKRSASPFFLRRLLRWKRQINIDTLIDLIEFKIMILAAFLGVSLAAPQDEYTQMEGVTQYASMTQDNITELHRFRKAELEGEDIGVLEPEIIEQSLRKKRSPEASLFFLRDLFRNLIRRNNYGYYYNDHCYGHQNYHGHGYGHGYNRGYRNYGRHYHH
eukprot:TCALIF_12340-PA protein Name:"Protein of unknown function" AED:0.55 eAED:0.55 QI:0/0/0/0.25/1/1/4/0/289